MTIRALPTRRVVSGALSLASLLSESIHSVQERSIVVISSKVVSLCESRTISQALSDASGVVEREADAFVSSSESRYDIYLTIVRGQLIASSGIDETNVPEGCSLLPEDPQRSANIAWSHMRSAFGLVELGVIIADSATRPLMRGSIGVCLAHSGFRAANVLVGEPDLFGRQFAMTKTDIAGSIASAAVAVMGEASEQTPIAIVSDLPFVHFQDRAPSADEIRELAVSLEEDVFSPVLRAANWNEGGHGLPNRSDA